MLSGGVSTTAVKSSERESCDLLHRRRLDAARERSARGVDRLPSTARAPPGSRRSAPRDRRSALHVEHERRERALGRTPSGRVWRAAPPPVVPTSPPSASGAGARVVVSRAHAARARASSAIAAATVVLPRRRSSTRRLRCARARAASSGHSEPANAPRELRASSGPRSPSPGRADHGGTRLTRAIARSCGVQRCALAEASAAADTRAKAARRGRSWQRCESPSRSRIVG